MKLYNRNKLDGLLPGRAENWHIRSFKNVTEKEVNSINGKLFIIEYNNFKSYVNDVLVKLNNNVDYMLSFSFVLDDNENKPGLLTTVVNGAGDHFLFEGKAGKGKYILIDSKPHIEFADSSPVIDDLKATVYNFDNGKGLDDNWTFPKEYFEKPPANISSPTLKEWLSWHDVDECLKNYKEYANGDDDIDKNDVCRATNYISLWELKGLLDDKNNYSSIGIFPIVMKSESKNFLPHVGHFMSLMFVPLNGKEYDEGFKIDKINTEQPFVLSGKGYPKAWRDTSELITKQNSMRTTFDLNEF